MKKRKHQKWSAIVLVCSLLVSLLPVPGTSFAAAGGQGPALLITEVVPDTTNVSSKDGYEFIEVYNQTDQAIDLKQQHLYYINSSAETEWTLSTAGQAVIQPRQSIVLWMMNGVNGDKTTEDFNKIFGSALVEDINLFRVKANGGLSNSDAITVLLKDGAGNEIVRASYENDEQTKPDKGIFYQHPKKGSTVMAMMDHPGTLPATPGAVAPEQLIPVQPISKLKVEHQSQEQIYAGIDVPVYPAITGYEGTVTADVYYKTELMIEFRNMPLTVTGDTYGGAIPNTELLGSETLLYYIQAQDSQQRVQSDIYSMKVVSLPADSGQAPPMLITELLPNSKNVGDADGYEFIEVYNNTDKDINFKDYKIFYRYTDSGPGADVVWPTDHEDLMIKSRQTMVFWVINKANMNSTVADFNREFGTNLVENENIVKIYSDGMANTSRRGVVIGTNTHKDIAAAYYDGSKVNQENKGTHYRYSADGTGVMLPLYSGTKPTTPGAVDLTQIPAQLIHEEDRAEPTAQDLTKVREVAQTEDISLILDAKDDQGVKTVALFYKTNQDAEYTKRYLYEDYNNKLYSYKVYSPELIGKSSVSYYFEVSDGLHTIQTDAKQIKINGGIQETPLRLNVKDGDIIRGTKVIKAAANGVDADQLKLSVAGSEVKNAFRALELDPIFAFDATEVNYYFKNAVTMGEEILYTFLDPINTYTTLSYPISSDRLSEGSNKIAIRAGTKSGPFDDRPEENKDDFKVRNVRLVLADGTTIYDPAYSNKEQEIKMGDSSGRLEALELNFSITNEHLTAKAYQWNTAELQDGEYVLETIAPDQSRASAKVKIDNTAPKIIPSIANGKEYRGAFTMDAEVTDNIAGVDTISAILDDKEVKLPLKTSSGELAAGTHTLVIRAKDKVGNEAVSTITFTTPSENPNQPELVTPRDGQTGVSVNPTLSVKLTDPLKDSMTASFFRGFHFDSSRLESLKGYRGASEVEPPKQLVPDGEQAMSAEDYDKIKAADGVYLTDDSTEQFPYHRFDITLDKAVKATDRVEVEWKGNSLEGRKVSMYAWNPSEQKWSLLVYQVAGAEDFTLKHTVLAGDYNDGGKIHVMIQDEKPVSEDPYDFSFVWMSDTQYYSESYPEIYKTNVQWIVDNKEKMDIRYVIHTGDIVDDADQDYQWINANESMSILDQSGMPYGVLAGNHDVAHQTGDYQYYWKHYGEDRFSHQPTYGGSYQNNRGHYDLVSAGGVDFIVVYMGWNIGDEEIQWIDDVLKQYPDRKAILAFHEYLLVSGNRAPIADQIHERVVIPNSNVIAVLSGHYHDAETLIDELDDNGDGIADRKVYQMLADYQGGERGGNGYIRLLQFDTDANKIHVKTYSPYLDDYNYYDPIEFPKKDEFDIDVDLSAMEKRVATDYFQANIYTDQLIGKVEKVASGAQASVKWSGLQNNQLYQWYVQAEDQHSGKAISDIWSFQTGTSGGGSGGNGSGGSGSEGGSGSNGNGSEGSTDPGDGQEGSNGNGSEGGSNGSTEQGKSFVDVPATHWAHTYIQALVKKGIVNGMDDTHFRPSQALTRAEFAKLIAKAFELKVSGSEKQPFSDVVKGSWYESSVYAAQQAGIIEGTGKGHFEPNRKITREEMAVMLVRAYEWKHGKIEDKGEALSFADHKKVSKWAVDGVAKVAALGLMEGQGGNTFAPDKHATRAEAAKVIYLLLER
ncbi:S-layer homology domain-containing protein [Paenibacillus sp. 1001270B_150601_E10]|uniref:S-layer homology domain-containing protein n=1 Tax=Paenibacillus sp. 1001270B_150601_E10 TaxID=2787079 RepID=UPI00189FA932|nr:S-layer homology domain-containing protein [Paenibacillus sp. 1001270B_150601_E10]